MRKTVIRSEDVIGPVSIRVAKSAEEVGRVERYNSASELLTRLEQVGRRRLVIHEITEGANDKTDNQARALTLYLWAGSGLKYLRRKTIVRDRGTWELLKRNLSI